MHRSYRIIQAAETLPPEEGATTGGGNVAGIALFVIGTLGGVAAMSFVEWKADAGGPQAAIAQAAEPLPDPEIQRPAKPKPPGIMIRRPAPVVSAPENVNYSSPAQRASRPAAPRTAKSSPAITPSGAAARPAAPQPASAGSAAGGGPAPAVKIHRILVGAAALQANVLPPEVARAQADADRYVVYFQLSVSGPSHTRVTYADFRLEDASGLIYNPLRTRDALGEAPGGSGVAFAVYNDSAPARLMVRTGGDRFVALPDSIFRGSGR